MNTNGNKSNGRGDYRSLFMAGLKNIRLTISWTLRRDRVLRAWSPRRSLPYRDHCVDAAFRGETRPRRDEVLVADRGRDDVVRAM